MQVVNQLWSSVSGYYRTLNRATLSGAIDVIVVRQPDGSLKSSPFHARFGKSGILRPQDNVVELYVNDELVPDIQMKLGEAGEAFFLEEADEFSQEESEPSPTAQAPEAAGDFDRGDDSSESEGGGEMVVKPVTYYSDGEPEERAFASTGWREAAGGYKSDSDLDAESGRLTGSTAAMQLAEQMEWEWGQLPHSPTADSVRSADYCDCEETPTATSSTQPELSSQPVQIGDRYLDELDADNLHLYLDGEYSRSPESGYMSDRDVETYLNVGVRLSLCGGLDSQRGVTTERFLNNLISYEELARDPDLIDNKNLVVRIQGRNFNWRAAGPILLCRAAFGQSLPHKAETALRQRHMPHRRKRASVRSWFTWGRAEEAREEETNDSGLEGEAAKESTDSTMLATSATETDASAEEPRVRLVRSVRLSSERLQQLRLRPGYNELRYSVTTKYQGTTECRCGVYLWGHDDRIVISDIDGTITKSDVLGHILPMVGKDWTQPMIARLFSAIVRNDYHFLYLSARAIGQSAVTRRFLQRVRQEGLPLPDGPVLLSPQSLLRAFHQEVIAKRPEAFKIACLKDVRSLYPADRQPFWAGFGNRASDTTSYAEVGIPNSRCFIVNPQGEVKKEKICLTSSYQALSEEADHVFPPYHAKQTLESEFSEFEYWRQPLPTFEPLTDKKPSSEVDADADMLP